MSEPLATGSQLSQARDGRQFEPALEHVRQALVGLKFGEVSIIVQDGAVVQVERIERKRFRRGER